MKIVPIVLMFAAVIGAYYYVVHRLIQLMPPTTAGRIILITLAVLLFLSPFLSILAGNVMPLPVTTVLYRVGTSWLIIFLYLLITLFLLDILRLSNLLPIGKYMTNSWIGFGTLALFIGLIMTMGYVKYTNKTRVELNLQTNKKLAKPLKVVAVSDLHLGYGIGRDEFAGWIELINKEEADIVLMAGDVIDNSVKPLYEQDMQQMFSSIKSRYGVFATPGNHEYISGITKSDQFLHTTGITLLKDSAVLIDNQFYVVGRDDLMNPNRKEINEIIAGLDPDKPILMLDHQPFALEKVAESNIDFQISGHTHGGQIWPITWVTQTMFEKSHGYLQKGNSHIYVSSGLGIWGGKFRIGTQSEYVVIHFK